MYDNTLNNNLLNISNLIKNSEFEKAYNALKNIGDKTSKWYYLNSISSMNLGYYEEGEESILKATAIEPENEEYKKTLDSYNFYRDNYKDRSYRYNKRKRRDLDCCCCCCDDCCCLGDDCCEDCMKLWCLDSVCECFGGDFIECC